MAKSDKTSTSKKTTVEYGDIADDLLMLDQWVDDVDLSGSSPAARLKMLAAQKLKEIKAKKAKSDSDKDSE